MEVANLSIGVDSTQVKAANQNLMDLIKTGMGLEAGFKGLDFIISKLQEMKNYAKEAVMEAARYETLGIVMTQVGRHVGYTAIQMEDFTKSLQKTGISMTESRNTLTQMASAQMDLTASSKLARIAQDAAVIGNINSSEAFQRMIYGIRSGQTEVLRTIGINVMFDQSYQKMAVTLNKTVSQLTDQEKRQARTNEVVKFGSQIAGAYEASMETMGKQILSAQRYTEDLTVSIGAFLKPIAQLVVTPALKWLEDTSKGMKKFVESADGQKMINNVVKPFAAVASAVLSVGGAVVSVAKWFYDWKDVILTVVGVLATVLLAALSSYVGIMTKAAAITAWNATVAGAHALAAIFQAGALTGLAGAATVADIALSKLGMSLAGVLVAAAVLTAGLALLYLSLKPLRDEIDALEEHNRKMEASIKNVTDPYMEQRAIIRDLKKEHADYQAVLKGTKKLEDVNTQEKLTATRKRDERIDANALSPQSAANYKAAMDKQEAEQAALAKEIEKDKTLVAAREERTKKDLAIRKQTVEAIYKERQEQTALNIAYTQGATAAEKWRLVNEKKYTPGEASTKMRNEGVETWRKENEKLIKDEIEAQKGKYNAMQDEYNIAGKLELIESRRFVARRAAIDMEKAEKSAVDAHKAESRKPVMAADPTKAFADFTKLRDLIDPTIKSLGDLEDELDMVSKFEPLLRNLGIYDKAITGVRLKEMALRAEAGQVWPIIGTIVANSSQTASDALVDWMDKLNGTARTWKSFGDTVRKVLSDMIVQMQKALMQQQLMKPLFDAMGLGASNGGSFLSSLFGNGGAGPAAASGSSSVNPYDGLGFDVPAASGGYRDGSKPYLVGENGPEIFTPGKGGSITPNNKLGGSVTNNVTVNVQSDGSSSTSKSDNSSLAQLGSLIGAKVREVIVTESRQGGLLART